MSAIMRRARRQVGLTTGTLAMSLALIAGVHVGRQDRVESGPRAALRSGSCVLTPFPDRYRIDINAPACAATTRLSLGWAEPGPSSAEVVWESEKAIEPFTPRRQ